MKLQGACLNVPCIEMIWVFCLPTQVAANTNASTVWRVHMPCMRHEAAADMLAAVAPCASNWLGHSAANTCCCEQYTLFDALSSRSMLHCRMRCWLHQLLTGSAEDGASLRSSPTTCRLGCISHDAPMVVRVCSRLAHSS